MAIKDYTFNGTTYYTVKNGNVTYTFPTYGLAQRYTKTGQPVGAM